MPRQRNPWVTCAIIVIACGYFVSFFLPVHIWITARMTDGTSETIIHRTSFDKAVFTGFVITIRPWDGWLYAPQPTRPLVVVGWVAHLLMWVSLALALSRRWLFAAGGSIAAMILAALLMVDLDTRTLHVWGQGYVVCLASMWLLAAASSVMVALSRKPDASRLG